MKIIIVTITVAIAAENLRKIIIFLYTKTLLHQP